MTGRDGQKVLKYVYEHPNHEVEYRTTLVCLYELSQWASIEKFKLLSQDVDSVLERLKTVIQAFSDSWRNDKLPAINKLHLVEMHLADFIVTHNGWGVYGEQGKH